MARLLIVEDEPKMLRILQRNLEADGYDVAVAATGHEGQSSLARGGFDGVILDWMLPGRDGLELLAELRRNGNRVPVLLLTARDAVEDRVAGLDCGADDYLVKPFATVELLARVRAMLRRGADDRVNVLRVGELDVDLLERRVRRASVEVPLRPREYEVLVYLLRHEGRIVTRDMLGHDVWKEPQHDLTNVIDVTMAQLRRKLDQPGRPPLIETVRGVGFCLRG
jgi:two-component system, OmpR family, copper resistance phosphate regulon response regulator CusR